MSVGEPAFEQPHRLVGRLVTAFGAVEGGAAFGGIEQLDCGHDVQHPVDLTVPASDSRWRTLSPEEASIGAVPIQEPKWFLSGNRLP